MKIDTVIRPENIHATPNATAKALGATIRKSPSRLLAQYRGKCFFFTYPHPDRLSEASQHYGELYDFFSAHKAGQRSRLSKFDIPALACYVSPPDEGTAPKKINGYIKRPLRHHSGRAYEIIDDPTKFREGYEYVSPVFPKTREYRIIFVLGEPLVVLRKKNAKELRPEEAWNHVNGSYFQTCNEPTKLHATDAFERLRACPILQNASIVGVDILYRKGEYRICEFNACPSLTIPENFAKIIHYIQEK